MLASKVASKVALSTPVPTEADAKKADQELNDVYTQLKKTLDKQGQKLLTDAERQWLGFRDQWLQVAVVAYNDSLAAADAKRMLLTKLTQERTGALRQMLAGPDESENATVPAGGKG